MNLTDEQKWALQVAMAEIAGWKFVRLSTYNDKCPVYQHPNTGACTTELPNYPEDLNAVHEVEMSLEAGKRWSFRGHLAHITGDQPIDLRASCIHATALQRCIALVMTLAPEKWEEIRAMGKDDKP